MNSKKLVFVAGIHGNEKEPVKALVENNIDFILGNPKAYEKDLRFVESDLNASFGLEGKGCEVERAKEILDQIDESDLVVDFHTTTADTPPFVIIVDEEMLSLARKTGLEHVVIMKHNIKNGHSLLNHRNGISIEAGKHNSKESYKTTLDIVENISLDKSYAVKFYEVYDKITEPGKYINFEENKEGFIPVLAGETSYDFYGLKAKRIDYVFDSINTLLFGLRTLLFIISTKLHIINGVFLLLTINY